MFRQQVHPSIWKYKRDFNMAIDLMLIPYHGKPYDKKEFVRFPPRFGTTYFHGYGYATVSIVLDDRHYVIALQFIEYGEEMAKCRLWWSSIIRKGVMDDINDVVCQHNHQIACRDFACPSL